MSEAELAACAAPDCSYFIAPCSLIESSPFSASPASPAPPKYLSLKKEAYLNEFERYTRSGFCPLAARPMPAGEYNRETCKFYFVKRPGC